MASRLDPANTNGGMVNTVSLVEAFDPSGSERARSSRVAILDLLHNHPRPLDRRSFDPGHITASAVVLSHDRGSIMLVHHRRLDRWLQPGGHVEPGDNNVIETARREVREETGLELDTSSNVSLVGADVHAIPASGEEPRHLHHDLTFGFTASVDAAEPCGSERAIWCAIDQLDSYGVDEPLRASLERTLSPSPSSPPDLL